ncbi:MAG: tandem-95 repeat protein [Nanoarchaeota archaeon]|nr:tandem-95 repeat protein [Nanoarchaeota archaeon]
MDEASITIHPGSQLIIDGTLLYNSPDHPSQYLLNTGVLDLRCGVFPAPRTSFTYVDFGETGIVIDSACPGDVDKIIIDGNDVIIGAGETATIPVGRDAIILNNLYVAGLIDNFGSVSNQGLVSLDFGTVDNKGSWNNVCDNFDTRGVVNIGDGSFIGNTPTQTICALPIAVNDNYSVSEDSALIVSIQNGVLANDNDLDSPILTVTPNTLPNSGLLSLNSDGSFTYVPFIDFSGSDTFSYKIDDGTGGFATGFVTIAVTSTNDPPIAVDDNITVMEDSLVTNIKNTVLINDSDPDGDVLTIVSAGTTITPVGIVSVAGGQLTYNPNNQFETLAIGETSTDSFDYVISDGNGEYSSAIISVTITGQNDRPTTMPDTYTINQNNILSIAAPGVLVNDSDIDGDNLTANLFQAPQFGNIVFNVDGSFTYTPNPNFFGEDSFLYRASDTLLFEQGTVTITVKDVTAPIITVNPLDINIGLGSPAPNLLSGVSTDDNSLVTFTGNVDTNTVGDYVISYNSIDVSGNIADTKTRTYHVVDTIAPDSPVIESPIDGSTTNSPSQTITGSAEPGSTIEVFVDGTSVGTTTADSNGDWSFGITLSEGAHQITATASDGINTSLPSNPINITLVILDSLLQQKIALIEQLENLINSAQDKKTKEYLKKAIDNLRKGANPNLYSNDENSFLDKKSAEKALKYDTKGIKYLIKIFITGQESDSFKAELGEITVGILRIDKQLIINTNIARGDNDPHHDGKHDDKHDEHHNDKHDEQHDNELDEDDLSKYDDHVIDNFNTYKIKNNDIDEKNKIKMSWKEFTDKLKSEGKWNKKIEKEAEKAAEKAAKEAEKAAEKAAKEAEKAAKKSFKEIIDELRAENPGKSLTKILIKLKAENPGKSLEEIKNILIEKYS